MTTEDRTNIRVGLTVLIGIAMLLLGIAWAKHWQFGGRENHVQAIFPTAGGLEPGDPVMMSGLKCGAVREVESQGDAVLVTMVLDKPVDFRIDAKADISMLELMSGKKVDLWRGVSQERLPANGVIQGAFSGDISSLVGLVTSLSHTLESIIGKTDTLFASLNGILRDDSFKSKLNTTLDHANSAMGGVDAVTTRVVTLLDKNGPELTRTLANADTTLELVASAIGENRAGLRVLVDSGGQAIADARRSLTRLDSILAGGEHKNTLLYRLTRDQGFSLRIDSALESLTKLSEQIQLQGIDANVRFWSSSKPIK